MHIDIGYGDAITPAAIDIEYPSLLDQPATRLRAYPPETVAAEKFQAMVALGMFNTRLKDFYDIWAIGGAFAFKGAVLARAIETTFGRRQTLLPQETPPALTPMIGKLLGHLEVCPTARYAHLDDGDVLRSAARPLYSAERWGTEV